MGWRFLLSAKNTFTKSVGSFYEAERNYAFHWQDENDKMIMRWDNAPHYSHLLTFPHHKHTPEGVSKSTAVTLRDVLDEIGMRLKLD